MASPMSPATLAQATRDRDAVWAEIEARPSTLRPWGSALRSDYAGQMPVLPRVGRTLRPRSMPACRQCGNIGPFFCDCGDSE